MPDLKYFGLESMSEEKADEVREWHAKLVAADYIWNNQLELEKYCDADARLLREGCLKFREIVLAHTAKSGGVEKAMGVDPFRSKTIAGAAMSIFRCIFMPIGIIAALSVSIVRKLKGAFAGGRTGCCKLCACK